MTPAPPASLPAQLHEQWKRLAAELNARGTLHRCDCKDLERYIMLSWQYDAITPKIVAAINHGESQDASVWIGSQERLSRQIKTLAIKLGLDAETSKARKLPRLK